MTDELKHELKVCVKESIKEFFKPVTWLLCFVGLHKWRDSFYTDRKNNALGLRCVWCNTWHKTAHKWSSRHE